jgi:hypothetical protein
MSLREVDVLDSVSRFSQTSSMVKLARNDGRIFSFLMQKYILPSNENTRKNQQHKSERVDNLLYLWGDLEAWIHHMNRLIDEDDEASPTIERWKWEEVKHSETEGYHRREDDDATNLHTIVSKSDKDTTNSDRTTDTSNGFFFLLSRRVRRKTRRNNGSKCTERKANLSIHLDHAVSERVKYSILIPRKCDIWSDISTYFSLQRCEGNLYFLSSSEYFKLYWSS